MAKQSFSVGQVLTAAQMTSLQQTAMLGGSATAQTASYTLVAADAGTVVSVNSISATTITVDTGLFSAGDTVTIQNWGSGLVTITDGTATVNTAGSLIVPQYDGGVLYFTSASEAIYFDFVQAGAVSPLTTKGDLYTFGSSDTRLGVGANDTVLTADSSEATGLKWAAPASSGGMTLLSTTTLSGTSTTISGISGDYTNLVAIIYGFDVNTATGMRINPNSNAGYARSILGEPAASPNTNTNIMSGASIQVGDADEKTVYLEIKNYARTDTRKPFLFWGNVGSGDYESFQSGLWNRNNAITSLVITTNNGTSTYSSGTVLLYGVK